jgi:hypothetical protein
MRIPFPLRLLQANLDQEFEVPQGATGLLALIKQTPWPLVRERTIPTERPPLVDEI